MPATPPLHPRAQCHAIRHSSFVIRHFAAFVLTTAPAFALEATITPQQKEFFEKKIAPILSDNCYRCHSVEAGKSRGGLTLDSREGVLKGGDDGKIIVPGDPTKSSLVSRLLSKDPEEKMPPKDDHLTPEQIAALTEWVKMGAPDPRIAAPSGKGDKIYVKDTSSAKAHWAFLPVKNQMPPAVRNVAWARNGVDNFVLSKLEAQGMTPNKPADRASLIRRAYFDLIGLPPMPWEVQQFVEDKTPNAWEKVVDRLLASPHYGERWGRYWLDVARYSDTKGDVARREDPRNVDAWTYRDYVIESFNADRPYDEFIRHHLAADSYATGPDKRPLAALGFLTVGDRFNGNKNDIINDRIDALSKGFLGLTVACARCHDHMFDPIPQKDYYSLHGIFASTAEPKDNPIIQARGTAAEYQDYLAQQKKLNGEAREFVEREANQLRAMFRKDAGSLLLASVKQGQERGELIRKAGFNVKQADDLVRSLRQGGNIRDNTVLAPFYLFERMGAEQFYTRFERMLNGDSPLGAKANMKPGKPTKPAKQEAMERRAAAGGKIEVPKEIQDLFLVSRPKNINEVAALYTKLFQQVATKVAAQKAAPVVAPASAVSGPAQPANNDFAELASAPVPRTLAEDLDPRDIYEKLPRNVQGAFQKHLAAIDKLDLTHPGAPRRAMAVEDTNKPQNSPVFIRGEANNRGEVVPRRFLEILSSPQRAEFTQGSGRKDLADAIASKSNPLTARVMMNRVWLHHFGEGIVTTPDDLGVQAAPPSHPELLDYLATAYMNAGWKLKPMHKLIMMSATYQQSTETNDAFATKDPNNRLLWRYNMRRLDFEALRDSLLYVGGKLDTKTLGGQPVNILSEPFSNRRSVYGYIDRANLPEMMNHFDFANPGMPIGKRHETTVPQQALFMMNSPLVVEVARKLLDRPEMKPADTDEKKVHALYWMIYQRPAKPEEIKLGLQFIAAFAAPNPNDTTPASAEAEAAPEKDTPLARRDLAKLNPQQRKLALQEQKKAAKGKYNNGFQLENKGDLVERRALNPWEKYTQALLMANEVVYFN